MSVEERKCAYCQCEVFPSFRQEGNHRKHWFCCDYHRTHFYKGKVLCQSCKKHYNKNYNKDYYLKNKKQIISQAKEYFKKTYIPHPKIFPKKECIIFDCEMKHYGKGLCKIHYCRNYHKENPTHKSNANHSIELQLAMNNVRKRDNNTCQWYNCKLTTNETIIHVHHIFPKSKYPKLQLIEKLKHKPLKKKKIYFLVYSKVIYTEDKRHKLITHLRKLLTIMV